MTTLDQVRAGYEVWAAKPHNAKWVKRLDGTPIANDIIVCIFDALSSIPEQGVGVKALEWSGKDYITGREHAYPHDTGMPCYTVSTKGDGKWWRGITPLNGLVHLCANDAEAKAAAQADFEQRILSALAAPSQPAAVGEELAELEALFELQHAADMRATARWRAAHPGNDLVLPDHADLVVWLLGQMDEMREALKPFAAFAPNAEDFVERAAATPGHSPIMPATKAFRVADFRRAAALVHRSTP